MPDPIVYVDSSKVRDGKLEELDVATKGIKELAAFIEEDNPRVNVLRLLPR